MLLSRFGRFVRSQMPLGDRDRLLVGELRVAVEVGLGVLERAVAQLEEALEVPAPDVGLLGVQVEREVDEVRHVDAPAPALEDVHALEHEHVRRAHDLRLVVETS